MTKEVQLIKLILNDIAFPKHGTFKKIICNDYFRPLTRIFELKLQSKELNNLKLPQPLLTFDSFTLSKSCALAILLSIQIFQ